MKTLRKIEVTFMRSWLPEGSEVRRYEFDIREFWFRVPGNRYSMIRSGRLLCGEVVGVMYEVAA